MVNHKNVSEVCGCGEIVESDEGHEIQGKVLCFDCFEVEMDEALFGDPFGEW